MTNSIENINKTKRLVYLEEFIGQSRIKKNIRIFIDSAKKRNDSLDHVIFYGPPGFGKTTLANIIAHEMGVNFKPTAAPLISKPYDLASLLTNLKQNDVFFIDEIHRINRPLEEILYPAMEDYHLDIIAGKGVATQSIRIQIPKFTLIGATTRIGMLSKPLRDRFGISVQFEQYSDDELIQVMQYTAKNININLTNEAFSIIAKCSRGTPRIAIKLLKRVRDFMESYSQNHADESKISSIMQQLGIDTEGLDQYDRNYLKFIANNYNDSPVGIETIAAALSEDTGNIEETIEPYLIEKGFIQKTPKGRILSKKGISYCKKTIIK